MASETTERRCDYCQLPCPREPVTADYDGETYRFCCGSCRDAMASAEKVFTRYRDYRWFRTGVAGLDRSLPQGLPRNAFVLLTGPTGTRDRALQAELVWRTLRRGEPAVVVSFQQPPVAVVEQFLTLDWNVLPYLESGDLHVVDCFTYRLDSPDRFFDRLNDWNRHVQSIAEGTSTVVRDPSEVASLESTVDNCLEGLGMVNEGIVMLDSLTEFGALVQPVQAYDFVKDVRADVCKARFVPVFAGATRMTEEPEFPHDLEYVADGIVDTDLDGSTVRDTLLKRIRVRKMTEVLAIQQWRTFEYTSGEGMVPFDPETQMEQAAAEDGVGDGDSGGDDAAATDADRSDDAHDGGDGITPG